MNRDFDHNFALIIDINVITKNMDFVRDIVFFNQCEDQTF